MLKWEKKSANKNEEIEKWKENPSFWNTNSNKNGYTIVSTIWRKRK